MDISVLNRYNALKEKVKAADAKLETLGAAIEKLLALPLDKFSVEEIGPDGKQPEETIEARKARIQGELREAKHKLNMLETEKKGLLLAMEKMGDIKADDWTPEKRDKHWSAWLPAPVKRKKKKGDGNHVKRSLSGKKVITPQAGTLDYIKSSKEQFKKDDLEWNFSRMGELAKEKGEAKAYWELFKELLSKRVPRDANGNFAFRGPHSDIENAYEERKKEFEDTLASIEKEENEIKSVFEAYGYTNESKPAQDMKKAQTDSAKVEQAAANSKPEEAAVPALESAKKQISRLAKGEIQKPELMEILDSLGFGAKSATALINEYAGNQSNTPQEKPAIIPKGLKRKSSWADLETRSSLRKTGR